MFRVAHSLANVDLWLWSVRFFLAICASPSYCSNTFFTSPILRCIFPPAFSAVPRSRKSGFPVALPAFSFTLPFASLNPPLILSFVLDFIRTKSRAMNAAVVNWFATEGDQHTEKQTAGVAPRRLNNPDKIRLIVRLAGGRLVDDRLVGRHRLVFRARAVAARVPVSRDLCPGRLAVRDHQVCPVRSDCVVIP